MSDWDYSKYTTGSWTGEYSKISVDLQDGDDARAIAEAARVDNEDAEVIEHFGYLTIRSPRRLVIRQATVEEILGRSWNPTDLQLILSAYAGYITSSGQNGEWVLEWLRDKRGPVASRGEAPPAGNGGDGQ